MRLPSFLLILGTIVSVVSNDSAYANESISHVDILNQQLGDLEVAGRYSEAIPLAQEIIEINTERHGLSQGQHRQADGPYNLALWIFEQELPPASSETEKVLARLVNSYSEQKLWQQTNILLLHWFDVTQQALGTDAPQTVRAMNNLAAFYRKTHRDSEAYKLERQISDVDKELHSTTPF